VTLSFDVTLYTLQLGSRDTTTGWYAKNYASSTITMLTQDKAATQNALPPGVYVRNDKAGLTQDPVAEGDQVKLSNGDYFEIETVREHWRGDSFDFYECQLTLLPFKNLTGGTYTASSVEDARYRTKYYMETYFAAASLPNYIAAYGKPDLPMIQVYKTKGVDLVFALDEPSSEPLVDYDHYTIGYKETVPITPCCIDKTNIVGTKLMHQARTELRRIFENYPLGSLRIPQSEKPATQVLGSTTLYMFTCYLDYERDIDYLDEEPDVD
jgi:hypothetical protein